jgi:AraC-like DNA-binding protein
MKYLIGKNACPLIYVSSGLLLDRQNFIHPRRNLDTFVIILCMRGTLYIAQDERHYTLGENHFITLFAGHEHYGYRKSDQSLTYCWCHFKMKDDGFNIIRDGELAHFLDTGSSNMRAGEVIPPPQAAGGNIISTCYILPEHGEISPDGKAIMLFRQLLDVARGNSFSSMLPNYALSLLAMEISQEFVEASVQDRNRERNPKMEKIIEWIRVNYSVSMGMGEIARIFSYNPDYLSTAFHKYTGYPLMKYISMVRIFNAKKMLLSTGDGIKEIAYKVGFNDEKTFMKRFKQLENITPTTYRNAFNRIKIVK